MLRRIKDVGYSAYQGVWRPLFVKLPIGENIFQRDWDVLIILDACRLDALSAVASDYKFITEINSHRSVGSQSKEWLAKTFTSSYISKIRNTAYVSANPFVQNVFNDQQINDRRLNPANWDSVDVEDFAELIDLSQGEWNSNLGTVPPDKVTKTAIHVGRNSDWDRLIVHYMQPHIPLIGSSDSRLLSEDIFDRVRQGDISENELWDAYLATLRLVLDEVSVLLYNIDAPKVAISADHGEALGEWHVYGHPIGFLHPVVRRVPWVETSAKDTGSKEGSLPRQKETEREDQLKSLGYL